MMQVLNVEQAHVVSGGFGGATIAGCVSGGLGGAMAGAIIPIFAYMLGGGTSISHKDMILFAKFIIYPGLAGAALGTVLGVAVDLSVG